MGYGAYMSIDNNSSETVVTQISAQNCMYDNGHSGSNLSYFNNLTIDSGETLPNSSGQYIEAKNSGSCFFETSSFTLTITGLLGGMQSLNFTDNSGSWNCTGQPSYINVDTNNSGKQGTITITLNDQTS